MIDSIQFDKFAQQAKEYADEKRREEFRAKILFHLNKIVEA